MKERHDPTQKPYYKCLSCTKFRTVCGGIPTRGMDLQEWCEYMRDAKELAHLTNAHIAKEADISIGTIDRIMAININNDIMRSIARRIELAVIGPVGKHICEVDYDDSTASEKIRKLIAEVEYLRNEVEYWRKENDRKAKIIDKYLDA